MKTYKFNKPIIVLTFVLLILNLQSCKGQKKDSKAIEKKVNNYVQIATGQTVTYDNDGEVLTNLQPNDSLYGQDATYLKGKKMSFKKNEDGTVLDLNSGLMWQEIPTTEGFDWKGAKEYTENLETRRI